MPNLPSCTAVGGTSGPEVSCSEEVLEPLQSSLDGGTDEATAEIESHLEF